uniref:Uncharacterized protein n=1 Tax=Octopus bimaculoides TaxID=37653 RepID=A0A0L8FYH2_OCTBM
MINKRGMRTEPWWTPTSTQNSLLYSFPTLTLLAASLYMARTALTKYKHAHTHIHTSLSLSLFIYTHINP